MSPGSRFGEKWSQTALRTDTDFNCANDSYNIYTFARLHDYVHRSAMGEKFKLTGKARPEDILFDK